VLESVFIRSILNKNGSMKADGGIRGGRGGKGEEEEGMKNGKI
jgi:hypothetical protein